MSLNRDMIRAKLAGLNSAAQWNAFARHINQLWAMQGGPGIRIIKAEAGWLLMADETTGDIPGSGFNDDAYKIHVWRQDGWDWGSDATPLAFFVVGKFTKYGSNKAGRIAKFEKSASRDRFSREFAAVNYFTGGLYFCSSTRHQTLFPEYDSKLLVGSKGVLRTGEFSKNTGTGHGAWGDGLAWVIDPETGENTYSVPDAKIPDTTIFGHPLSYANTTGMACAGGFIGIVEFQRMTSWQLGGGMVANVGAEENLHFATGFSGSIAVPGRPTAFDGHLDTKGLRVVGSGLTIISGGTGSLKSVFTAVGDPLEISTTEMWALATQEYSSESSLDWKFNTVRYLTPTVDSGPLNACAFRATTGGDLASFDSVGMLYDGRRPEVFCVDDLGRLWLSGDVSRFWTRDVALNTMVATDVVPGALYRFDPDTGHVNEICMPGKYAAGEFVKAYIYDCKFFAEGPTVGRQYIIVGSFTFIGSGGQLHSAKRIAYITEDGTFLPHLEWP